eukprot:3204256-Rhodomonas_salina.5
MEGGRRPLHISISMLILVDVQNEYYGQELSLRCRAVDDEWAAQVCRSSCAPTPILCQRLVLLIKVSAEWMQSRNCVGSSLGHACEDRVFRESAGF